MLLRRKRKILLPPFPARPSVPRKEKCASREKVFDDVAPMSKVIVVLSKAVEGRERKKTEKKTKKVFDSLAGGGKVTAT